MLLLLTQTLVVIIIASFLKRNEKVEFTLAFYGTQAEGTKNVTLDVGLVLTQQIRVQ